MEPFSVAAGSLEVVASCQKVGKVLVRTYENYQNADREVSEMLLKLKALWDRTEIQMDILRKIWDSLEPSHQQNQLMLLNVLELKLQNTTRLLDSIIGSNPTSSSNLFQILKKRGEVKRSRYALSVKNSLENTIAEFLNWHSIFDPSWYLLAKVTSETLDRYLEASKSSTGPSVALKSLRKSIKYLETQSSKRPSEISSVDFLGERQSVLGSAATVAQFKSKDNHAVVDSMIVGEFADLDATTKDVKALVRALSMMDPLALGLLRCCGVINKSVTQDEEQLTVFDLVFEFPNGFSSPQSLRNLLKNRPPSLNFRVSIAKQLAASVLYLHTIGFVHKNIRSENILLFEKENSLDKSTFLVGFESFRMNDSDSYFRGDGLLERDLYRHPSRQGKQPRELYTLEHDMYSLGVCLLEIGLWVLFVEQSNAEGGFIPNPRLELTDILNIADQRKRSVEVKEQLLKIAKEELPSYMGTKFTDIAVNCLTCLDQPRPLLQPQNKRSEDIDAGIQFVEEVLTNLHDVIV